MSPQFEAAASIIRTEVKRITDKYLPVIISGVTVASPAVDVSHLPCGTVSSRLIDELRCKMNLGVVSQRVVLWVVLERTWRLIVDGDRNGERGRSSCIVRPNRIGCRRCLQDRWNAPDRSVARSEVESGWQGGVNGPRGDGSRASESWSQRQISTGQSLDQRQILR